MILLKRKYNKTFLLYLSFCLLAINGCNPGEYPEKHDRFSVKSVKLKCDNDLTKLVKPVLAARNYLETGNFAAAGHNLLIDGVYDSLKDGETTYNKVEVRANTNKIIAAINSFQDLCAKIKTTKIEDCVLEEKGSVSFNQPTFTALCTAYLATAENFKDQAQERLNEIL